MDRRTRNVGPPEGIERRRVDRRSHDRRTGTRGDRRRSNRRGSQNRRAAADHRVAVSRKTQAARVASRSYSPEAFTQTRTPRLLRVLLITLVAVACLLAATLTGPINRAGAAAKPKAKAVPGTVKAKSGAVSATLAYERTKMSGSLKVYGKLRLTVRAPGKKTLASVKLRGEAAEGWLVRPTVTLVDVTGDGALDAVIQTYTGGAHCCTVSAIAQSTETGWSKPITRNWADYGYELKNLDDLGPSEFKAYDMRFTGAYGPYAASRAPIQIFRLTGGVFTDVTREAGMRSWVQQDVTNRAKDWQDAATEDADFRGIAGRTAAAAWIADLLVLDQVAEAKAVVDASAARGDFAGDEGKGFPGQLGHDLKAWGYLADPAVIGLTDAPAPTTTP